MANKIVTRRQWKLLRGQSETYIDDTFFPDFKSELDTQIANSPLVPSTATWQTWATDVAEALINSWKVKAKADRVPWAPTGVTARAVDGGATVSFDAPDDIGGSPITNYIAGVVDGAIPSQTITG
eukprot:964867_1